MWTILKDVSGESLWRAQIDNDAVSSKVREELPSGKEVFFHPLDVISFMKSDTSEAEK